MCAQLALVPSDSCASTPYPCRRGKSAKVSNFGMQGYKKQKKLEKNASGTVPVAPARSNVISKKKKPPPRKPASAPQKASAPRKK